MAESDNGYRRNGNGGDIPLELVKWVSGAIVAAAISYFATVGGIREEMAAMREQIRYLQSTVGEIRSDVKDLQRTPGRP